jgi:hypothetical protein
MEKLIATRTLKKHFGARPPTAFSRRRIDHLKVCSLHSSKQERFSPNSS